MTDNLHFKNPVLHLPDSLLELENFTITHHRSQVPIYTMGQATPMAYSGTKRTVEFTVEFTIELKEVLSETHRNYLASELDVLIGSSITKDNKYFAVGFIDPKLLVLSDNKMEFDARSCFYRQEKEKTGNHNKLLKKLEIDCLLKKYVPECFAEEKNV